jgi:NitT/TauT family transport system substrate-binding protein
MKRFNMIALILISMIILAACSKAAVQQTEETGSQDAAATPAVTAVPDNSQDTAVQDAAATVTPAAEQAAAQTQDKIDIKIAALKGPTAIGMVKVMEDAASGTTTNNYTFTVAGAADEISTGLVKGDFDIAAVPCNLASVLYNKTKGQIKLAGINTLGVLYIVETGNTINSVEDLKGKILYSTGLGTTPQYTLNYLLTSYGIDPEKDVTIEYKSEPTEVAAVLSGADNAIAMLPQPYVTTVMMSNDKVRVALDIAKEWDAVSSGKSSVVTGVVVVRSDFLQNNKAAFDAFMEEYTASVKYVNENTDDAAALVEKFDIFKAAPAKKAIPYCNIVLIQGEEMKEKVNGYLSVLFGQNPDSVGGSLPAEDFYYMP